MKRIVILSTALCLALLAAGCTSNEPTQGTELTTTTTTTAEATESKTTTTDETVIEPSASAHQVNVETVVLLSSKEGDVEYTSVVPKITVDGKEATEINDQLKSYIQKEYPMQMDGDRADGMATKLAWGVKDNILSIVIYASETFTDYATFDVFNYDLDTLKVADDSAVLLAFGIKDEDFLSQTTEIVKASCTERGYDLEKSLAAVNFDKCSPFVTPDGTLGVAANFAYPADSQFSGGNTTRCFYLSTKDYFVIK